MGIRKAVLFFACVVILPVFISAALCDESSSTLSTLFEILYAIYDYDSSLIPDEPNEIIALQTSTDSRDQLAWALFQLIRYELDPHSMPPDLTRLASSEESSDPAGEFSVEQSIKEVDESSAMQFPMMKVMGSEPVADLYGPLDSCILTPGTYRIQTLPLEIEGHVVIPAGTTLIAPFDPNHAVIEVLPGGRLDVGRAAFYGTEDYPDVLPAVEIMPSDPNILFYHNGAGIYVHRGADPRTRLENLEIAGCSIGIIVDEKLMYPLRQVITLGCYDGIHLYAPAGIIDCEFWYNGSVWDWMHNYIWAHLAEYLDGTLFEDKIIASNASAAVYVHLDGEAFPYPEVLIERTVMDSADVGLYVRGVSIDPNLPDPNVMEPLLPRIQVLNSAFTLNNFYGLYKTEEEANMDVQYSAFGENSYYHTNADLPYVGCFLLSFDPFYILAGSNRLYVNPYSELADAGYGIATDGMGTAHDRPDTGILDIGCHFPLGVSGGFGIPSSPADLNWDGIVDQRDLDLMYTCMGATDDPNLVRMDFNYDSRINLPDYGVLAWDFGYVADPNLPGRHDPNSARSDFNGDGQVDLEDLAILAENWLIPVFDEYRFCSLCNLHTGIDPNDSHNPDGSHIIDQRDIDVCMADWGKVYAPDPNIVIEQSASMLSIGVENPDPAWKISVFLDEELIGTWEAGTLGSTAFDADLTRYGPGSHRLKIVRNIGYGMEITEQILSDPNSIGLYYADIPDTFEPNEPYEIKGFNLGNPLHLEIANISDEVVYDANVLPGAVEWSIPAWVFYDNRLCTITFTKQEDLIEDLCYTAQSPSGSDRRRYEKLLKEKFNPKNWDGKRVRVVFLLPDKRVTNIFWQAICSAIKAVENRNLTYVVLTEHDVNTDNFIFLFGQMPGRRIVIYFGHANSHAENVQRTCFQCFKKSTVQKPGGFYNVGAYSYTRRSSPQSPALPYYNKLPNPLPLDSIAYDVTQQISQCKIDKMFIFGCLSAAYPDMAMAQGCGSEHDHSWGDMMYCGYRYPVFQTNGGWVEGIGDNLVRGLSIFFDKIGEPGENAKTIWDGIVAIQQSEIGIRRQCLGFNGFYDADPSELDHQVLGFYGVHALDQKLE